MKNVPVQLALAALTLTLAACSPDGATGPAAAAPSFAGGSGGGGGGGGGGTTSCVPLQSYTPTAGYAPKGIDGAAIWVNFSVKNCGIWPLTIRYTLVEVGGDGSNDRSWGGMPYLAPNQTFSTTIDMEPVPYATTWTSTFQLLDGAGNVVDSRVNTLVTPKDRNRTGTTP